MPLRLAKPREVALETLAEDPGPYCLSFGFDLSPLIRSIEQVRLLNAPLLEEGRGPHPVIICGYRRILALKALGIRTCPARVLGPRSISPPDALLTSLWDNLATRTLNVVEKAMALSRLSSFFHEGELMERFMIPLGLPRREETLALYLAIDRDLDVQVKSAIVRERLGLRSVSMLLGMKAPERRGFFSLFEKIALNLNQQVEVIELVDDLSRIGHTSTDAILGCAPIAALLSEESLNGPQKAKALVRILRGMRFPRLVEAERAFKEKVSRFALPENVRISHPPFFEDPQYRMEILFKNGSELSETLGRVVRTGNFEALANPWEEGP